MKHKIEQFDKDNIVLILKGFDTLESIVIKYVRDLFRDPKDKYTKWFFNGNEDLEEFWLEEDDTMICARFIHHTSCCTEEEHIDIDINDLINWINTQK